MKAKVFGIASHRLHEETLTEALENKICISLQSILELKFTAHN